MIAENSATVSPLRTMYSCSFFFILNSLEDYAAERFATAEGILCGFPYFDISVSL